MTTRGGSPISDDADGVAAAGVPDELRGQRLGLLEPGGARRRVGHAQRAVEHQHPVRPLTRQQRQRPRLSRNGLAIAVTTRRTSKVRTARRSHCSIRIRREFLRIAASRNRIAAQRISRSLRRLSRWMMIGTDGRPEPPEQRVLAKPRANTIGSGNVILMAGRWRFSAAR